MSDLKKYYKDENDLIDFFCKSIDCSACNGSDQNGEPNGYGCPAMEKFTEENDHLLKEDCEIIEILESENKELKKDNKELTDQLLLLAGKGLELTEEIKNAKTS